MKAKHEQSSQLKHLSKTQAVLYQKEFKHADREYSKLSQKGNRS